MRAKQFMIGRIGFLSVLTITSVAFPRPGAAQKRWWRGVCHPDSASENKTPQALF